MKTRRVAHEAISNAEKQALKTRLISSAEKRVIFYKCGILSDLLTIAGLVSLVALGFLTWPMAGFGIAIFSFDAYTTFTYLSAYNKDLDKIRLQLAQYVPQPA